MVMALPASAPPAYVYRSSGAVISLTSCLPAPLAAVAAAAASPVAPLLLLLLLGLLRRTPLTAAVVAAAAPRRCCCHYHTCVASHRSLAASSSFPSPPRRLPLPPSPPPGSLVPVVVDARSCSPPPRRALACWISFDLQQSTMAIQAIGDGSCSAWCPYFDPDYETFGSRLNPPRVVMDNTTHDHFSVLKVDSVNTDGVLLDVVQILTDLDLSIPKAYISSDGVWFMDVFYVTTADCKKVLDEGVTDLIQKRLNDKCLARALSQSQKRGAAGVQPSRKTTIIELSGTDRPGLLSEISAVLTSQQCNVDAAECWTHRTRVACVAYVTDQATRGAILDQEKLRVIKELLSNVMRSDGGDTSGRFVTDFLIDDTTHSQRRMHQLLYDDRDYEINVVGGATCDVQVRRECGYSVVNIVCKDRPKLLFDTVCTLTDMGFVVFHATIDTDNGEAVQEYYIRGKNGDILDAEAERKVTKCLKAAIARRIPAGLRLELCTTDRVGLLSEITRIFTENGLSVTRADVATQDNQAVNVFYVVDASGRPVDISVVEGIREQIGQTMLKVAQEVPPKFVKSPSREVAKPKFSFGNLLKSQIFYNLGLIKPSYA